MFKIVCSMMLLFAAPSACAATEGKTGGNVLIIYYFPIGAETLTPVTTSNIESRGGRCLVASERDVLRLKKIVESSDSVKVQKDSFTDKRVRVKLVDEAKKGVATVTVVENGGIVKQGDLVRQLSDDMLNELKALVEGFCK